jgi:hypothetical protein
VLQRTELYANSDHLKEALLSTIDSSSFESTGANGNIAAAFKGIPFNLGFDAFNEARRKYFEQHSLNIDHESATVVARIGLDPQASALFESCIRGLANSQYGVSVFVSSEDETVSSVQIFWKATTSGQAILVEDSAIVNGTVEGAPKGKMFAKPIAIKDSKTRIITRTNPNKPIIVTFDTQPDVPISRIVIPPVPPLVSCEYKNLDHDPVTNQPFSLDQTLVADYFLDGKEGPNGSEFAINKTIDGFVTSVSCTKVPPADFIELQGSGNVSDDGKTAQCIGSKNGARRAIRMIVRWQKTYTQCMPIPWHSDHEVKQAQLNSR